jgi:hypothetical protein
MSYDLTLTKDQLAAIRTAAASLDPTWRSRFLASVQDALLWPARHHPITDSDVVAAVESVRSTFQDTYDDCC